MSLRRRCRRQLQPLLGHAASPHYCCGQLDCHSQRRDTGVLCHLPLVSRVGTTSPLLFPRQRWSSSASGCRQNEPSVPSCGHQRVRDSTRCLSIALVLAGLGPLERSRKPQPFRRIPNMDPVCRVSDLPFLSAHHAFRLSTRFRATQSGGWRVDVGQRWYLLRFLVFFLSSQRIALAMYLGRLMHSGT